MEANLVIINKISELERITQFLESYGETWGFDSKTIFTLNLVLEELITNTVFYGYDDTDKHDISIRMVFDNDLITLTIEDDGKPFDPFIVEKPEDLNKPLEERKIGGLGIHFVREIMDTYSYKRIKNTNRLVLTKKIK
jgi:serine/threonine-protein kinase RsbW